MVGFDVAWVEKNGTFIITSYIVFCLFFANLSRIGKENYLSKKVGVTTHDVASHCRMIELRVQLGCAKTISLNILKHLPLPLRDLFCYFSCLLNYMCNIFLPSVHVLHVHVYCVLHDQTRHFREKPSMFN